MSLYSSAQLHCNSCRVRIYGRRPALTKRQGELLAYLSEYIAANRYAPSFEEIARRFSYSSLATVHEHLSNLENKGFIARSYNESRAITILAPLGPNSERIAELRAVCDRMAAANGAEANGSWDEVDAAAEAFLNAVDAKTVLWLLDLISVPETRLEAVA